jgi:predicted Zn-dependent peptidase
MLMGQEDVMRRADNLGHNILAFGRPIPVSETARKIADVKRKDVEAIARKIFTQKPILTALGPLKNLESYGEIVKRLKN